MIKTKRVTPVTDFRPDVVLNLFISSRPHLPQSFCLDIEDRDLTASLWLSRSNVEALLQLCSEALSQECDEKGEFIKPLAVGDER